MSTEQHQQKLLTVSEAVKSRIACRDFLDKQVSYDLIIKILDEARRAPSSSNLQPWKIYLIHGENKKKLTNIIKTKMDTGVLIDVPLQFQIHPGSKVPIPGLSNKLKTNYPKYYQRYQSVGKSVYESQGIKRGDHKARMEAAFRGFDFFGAPVGLIFTIKKYMTLGSYPDLGIMAQTIMLLSQQYGLSTCPLVLWSLQHKTLRKALNIPKDELIFCGMAIGYKNDDAAVNKFKRERVSLDEMLVVPKINDIDKFESIWWFKFKMLLIILREKLSDYIPIYLQYFMALVIVTFAIYCLYLS